jgi:hypothetical protein
MDGGQQTLKKSVARSKPGKGKAPSGQVFLFPGPDGWEAWSREGGEARCVGPADFPKKLKPPAGAVVCLPSRAFYSMPIWVPLVEQTPVKDLAALVLERKGMLGANPEAAIWSIEAIRTQSLPDDGSGEAGARQLAATAILAVPFDENCIVEESSRYEVAGRVIPPPDGGSAAILRRELGRWVIDFYQSGKWLHTQPLLERRLGVGMAVELGVLLGQMEGEGVLEGLELLVLRDHEGHPEAPDFLAQLSVPSRMEDRTAPCLSSQPWNLPPPTLTERRLVKAEKAKQKKILRTACWVYAGLMALGLAYVFIPLVKKKMAEQQLAAISGDAEKIRAAAMAWREAGALVNPQINVLEVLWEVSRPLIEKDPPQIDGVRLTQFEYNGKHVFLTGEGKDLEQTEKYFNWLKNNKALAFYQWSHPQPRLLPNGNAQFQAEGIPPGGGPKESEEGGTDANANGS